jgi:hypothetical protein
MTSRGNLQRKCVKAHPKTAGKCPRRRIRYYPRRELPRGPDSTRRFEALGGDPTRSQAEAALADALARRSHGLALDPAKRTVDQYLDRWLAHIRTSLRARTVARYAALLRDHVRPHLGARPLKQLTPLEIQALYDRLALGGRRDGKPGGLAPQHILAVHRCLHRALAQAVTWRLLARNIATDTTPPPVPSTEVAALAPEQVALLLDAADQHPAPWLGPWIMLAVATGARNGELCGLEWADLDLDAGTVRFHQALTIIDPPSSPRSPTPTRAAGARNWPSGRSSPRHPGLASVRRPGAPPAPPEAGPLAARRRAAPDGTAAKGRTRPATPAGPTRPGAPHRAGHPGQPQPRQPRLRPPGRQHRTDRPPPPAAPCVGVGDGRQQGAGQHHRRPAPPCRRRRLAQRVYIHQLPQTAPRVAGVIEGVFGPAARDGRAVSAGCRVEGNRSETGASNPA